MSDPRKAERLAQRLQVHAYKVIDPDLYQVLNNHTGSKDRRLLNNLPRCDGAQQASSRD